MLTPYKLTLVAIASLSACGLCAANPYTYLPESFEGPEWAVKNATVVSSTGSWTSNKNLQSDEQAHDGQYSIKISQKAGITTPELTEGVDKIEYYCNLKNRQLSVATSVDGETWHTIESEKTTCDWTLHTLNVADPDVRYVKFSTNSNNQAYLDFVTITPYDNSTPGVEIQAPTIAISSISSHTALSDAQKVYVRVEANITSDGGAPTTEAGICFSATNPNPAIGDGFTKCAVSEGALSADILLPTSQRFFFCAYASNKAGISYSKALEFTTPDAVEPEYAHNVYYVAPDGDDSTADGSASSPFFELQKAVDLALPGDTIYMMPGTYPYSKRINISAAGEKLNGKIMLIAKDGRAVLDFSAMSVADANQGIRLTGSYWHIYGIDICNAGDNGMLIERNKPTGGNYNDIKANTTQGHDNIIENCRFYRNADTGLQMKNLAENNLVINCDSYYNADPDHGDADGYAVKISHGTGNYFYGCRAWANSDDGWDGFIKSAGGFPDDITTTLECCWAFENGYLEDGSVSNGNGNGFKMGSDQGRNNMVLNRCVAYNNLNKGFDQNHNTGSMILTNCSAYSTKDTSGKSRFTYRLDEPVAPGKQIVLTNCVAISDGIADRKKSAYAPHSVIGTTVTTDLNTLPSDYVSVEGSALTAERNADGSLPDTDFMRIAPGNMRLIDAGTQYACFPGQSHHTIGIEYEGEAPDLGYKESTAGSGITDVSADSGSGTGRIEIEYTLGGMPIVTIAEGYRGSNHSIQLIDNTGRVVASKMFVGNRTTISAPTGLYILLVQGSNFKASAKVKL